VIQSLRALTRKSRPQLTEFDINDAIQEVLTLAHSEMERHRIVLRTNLSDEVRPVFGDRVQLQQVLLNLVTNAVDAMSGVIDQMRELTVASALTEHGGLLVTITDTGAGLEPTIAQRIFEPFFTTKSDGLGMGLSICLSIIESHGGELWVSPNVPHGTVLRFTLPGAAPA
jgi:signal transduction histidine kinase